MATPMEAKMTIPFSKLDRDMKISDSDESERYNPII